MLIQSSAFSDSFSKVILLLRLNSFIEVPVKVLPPPRCFCDSFSLGLICFTQECVCGYTHAYFYIVWGGFQQDLKNYEIYQHWKILSFSVLITISAYFPSLLVLQLYIWLTFWIFLIPLVIFSSFSVFLFVLQLRCF